MEKPPADVRTQLQSLRISRDQRPAGAGSPRRRGRKLWVAGVLLLAAGAGAYLARDRIGIALPGSAQASEVRLIPVARRAQPDPAAALIATGRIVSDHKVFVSTKVSGQIVALFFEQGDRVEKGQVLAHIEDVIYRARRDEAAAQLERARANLAFHEINYARVEKLYRGATAPPIEFAEAERSLRDARAAEAAARAALEYAEKTLKDCEVVAPISGVILERNVGVGDFVAAEGGRGAMANSQLGAIADMSALRVEADISELDIARIRPGMPCLITPDARKDRRFHGHVMWIDPGANYSKATVGVKVRIKDPDDSLRVEGSAQVAFLAEAPASAPATQPAAGLWIPATASRRDASGKSATVFLAIDGHLRATPITIGRESGGQIEVTDGLREGQFIAAGPIEALRDGQRIKS